MTEKQWLEEVGDRSVEQLLKLDETHRIDSIVVAIEDALLQKEDLTAVERVVLAVEAMEREVNNGGFNQFFFNSSNEYAAELVPALRQIGAPRAAEIAERALRAIGAQPGWTYEDFEAASVEPDEPTEAALNTCDDEYFANDEAIAEKLFDFIKANKGGIRLGTDSA